MIYEDLLGCAEKVEGIGKFLKNMDPGDLNNSGEFFFIDAGQMLVKAAEEIIGHCQTLKEETERSKVANRDPETD